MTDLLVICYHAVSDAWRSSLAVSPTRLEAQVGALLARGYVPQTFTNAVLAPAGPRVLSVTFDDAYRSVPELAAPVLARLGVPATVFVPTGFMGDDAPMSWDGIEGWLETPHRDELRPASWEALRRLADRGWEIGAHTVTHPHLPALDDLSLLRELSRSRRACEAALDRPCRSIAYPYGDVDARVVAAAAQAGFTTGAGLPSGRLEGEAPLCVPRVGLYEHDAAWRRTLKTATPLRRLRASRLWDLRAA
jgi:peptidoglycan/xylan/chitin deacetylase (PgdA/CDA1 family)